jgi:2-dehydro-3-deoxyphosphogalactonate aldolase
MRLDQTPIIAILRGIRPDEVLDVARALFENGIRGIEVPMNSPDAIESVRRVSGSLGDSCLCGAGTVLEAAQVDAVQSAGGKLIVAPNSDGNVIRRAVALGLEVLPGFMTPTEAFAALGAGARHLKLFPAQTCGTAHMQALRAVLPRETKIFAVGGVGPQTIATWRAAGVDGIGVGSDIYKPGMSAREVAERAAQIVAAFPAPTH